MPSEITYVQNFLVKDSYLLKLLLVALGFGSQTFICGFSRQNICSVELVIDTECRIFVHEEKSQVSKYTTKTFEME